jgi:hypothetical protein
VIFSMGASVSIWSTVRAWHVPGSSDLNFWTFMDLKLAIV